MNNHFQIQLEVPYYELADSQVSKEYIEHRIDAMKREGALAVFEEIYKSGCPVVVETHLEEFPSLESFPRYTYRLHYRLTAVQSRNVVLPVFTYKNYLGEVEWKCPACSIINSIDATYCGEKHERAVGCGSPREKTKQELYDF